MISVVSPAKSLDFKQKANTETYSMPSFLARSEELVEVLRGYDAAALSKLMKISDKLGVLNEERYANWQQPFHLDNAKQAAFAFQGDVYQGLEADSFTEEDWDFAQDHFRILSGLYGILKPLDLIQPYRLEMGTSLKNDEGSNLYHFWGDSLTEELNSLMGEEDVLLNLASNEYFKAIQPKKLKAKVITPVFKDWKNGQYKIISFFAKKARGMMAAYQIKYRINDPAILKDFNEGGYKYSAEDSNEQQWVFLRKEA